MCLCTYRDGRHNLLSALRFWLRSAGVAAYECEGAANIWVVNVVEGGRVKHPRMDTFIFAVTVFLLRIYEFWI